MFESVKPRMWDFHHARLTSQIQRSSGVLGSDQFTQYGILRRYG